MPLTPDDGAVAAPGTEDEDAALVIDELPPERRDVFFDLPEEEVLGRIARFVGEEDFLGEMMEEEETGECGSSEIEAEFVPGGAEEEAAGMG